MEKIIVNVSKIALSLDSALVSLYGEKVAAMVAGFGDGPKISDVKKMGCSSWSLQARSTCAGAVDENGELVPACEGCYAVGGNYRFANVIAPRVHNKIDWKRDAWVSDMVTLLDSSRYFRWFDSGDMYSLALGHKILEVMKLTPWCNHWLPTRQHKFLKFMPLLDLMNSLDNVVVRFSSDSIDGELIPGAHTSTIIPTPDHAPNGVKVCEAYRTLKNGDMIDDLEVASMDSKERGKVLGHCGKCRACWKKDTLPVAYPAHGRKMLKMISLKEVA